MLRRDTNPSFMNGVPELLILQLLRTQEMYGYEIVQAIRDRSGGAISFGEGVVYPVLHALEESGALQSRRKTVSGRSRIYYAVTANGQRHRAGLADHWTKLASAIQTVLTGASHVPAIR